MTGQSAELIIDKAALAALEPAWWALWRRCPTATPFQSPAWLLNWWRHFSPGPLRTIAVWEGESLVGLAPCYLEEESGRLLPIGISLSDYLDVLVEPAASGVGERLVEAMHTTDWHSWEFSELQPSAAALTLDMNAPATPQGACPVLALSGGEDLATCVPARKRRQLRRAVARARARGETRIERVGDHPAEFLEHLLRLHRARWISRGEPGILDDARVQRFHEHALPQMLMAGLARCYTIRIAGEIVGAYYGFLDRGRAYAYLGGFDPAFSEESPGSILMGHAIAEAAREGASEFHFLRGQERYKYDWGGVDRWNQRRVLLRGSA
jgi:CelD/BcsL family acetyltransferase involved in cellulose biosynthesis